MIIVIAQVRVREEKREEAVRLASEFARSSRGEPGCIGYRFYNDLDEPNLFFLFEQWESAEALEVHFGTPNMDRFNQRLPALIEGEVEVQRFEAEPLDA